MEPDELHAAIVGAGVCDVRGVTRPSWGGERFHQVAEGTIRIAGVALRLGIGLHADFPDTLPKVHVLSREARSLPHVDGDGYVCVFDGEGTLHDHRCDAELVRETIERARAVIEDGLLGRKPEEILNELEAYWVADLTVPSVVTPSDAPGPLHAFYSDAKLVAVADTEDALAAVLPDRKAQSRTGIYLPLDPHRVKAEHPQRFVTWGSVFSELTEDAMALLRRTSVKKKHSLLIVFGVPRRSGGRALIGLLLRKFRRDGSLVEVEPQHATRVKLDRLDDVRIRERALPGASFTRIAVIGCGAVGGHIAHALAWNGARELVLVDPDRCDGGNTFRHVLGRTGWSASKVVGLKRDLEKHVPHLTVTTFAENVADALAARPDLFRSLDAIVVAIGNQSVPLRLNDDFAAERLPVPVIYTWLEPHGIGGHALLVRYGAPGCLRCVFEDDPELHCTTDFAAPGQVFARRELGCHGSYTPYADLDARETALAAARLLGRVAREPKTPAWVRSWRGDATAFLSAGFRLAARYEASPNGYDGRLEPRSGCSSCAV